MQACRRGQVQPYNDRKGGQQHPVSGQVRSLHLDDPPMPHAHTTSKHRTNTSLGVMVWPARLRARWRAAQNEPAWGGEGTAGLCRARWVGSVGLVRPAGGNPPPAKPWCSRRNRGSGSRGPGARLARTRRMHGIGPDPVGRPGAGAGRVVVRLRPRSRPRMVTGGQP